MRGGRFVAVQPSVGLDHLSGPIHLVGPYACVCHQSTADVLLPCTVSPEWVEERKLRWGVTSPIYQSKVPGELPDISDDTLILPKWIEAAQKRTLERTRRPIIAADIARFGEDETVIMRREGGWIRVYRAHHKADTMTTVGHIAKAMGDIDEEAGKNDWVRAIIDVPASVGEWWTAWPSSNCRSRHTTVAGPRSTRNGSSTLALRTIGHCASGSNRASGYRPR